MPVLVQQRRIHPRVRFRTLPLVGSTPTGTGLSYLRSARKTRLKDETANRTVFEEAEPQVKGTAGPSLTNVAAMFSDTNLTSVPGLSAPEPRIRDALKTETSKAQDETVQSCLPLLAGDDVESGAVPRLERQRHIAFLQGSLGNLPSGFVAADASRPFMLYWALTGLYLLGEDVSKYRER